MKCRNDRVRYVSDFKLDTRLSVYIEKKVNKNRGVRENFG